MKRPKFPNFFQKNKSKLKLLKIWSLILLGLLIIIEIVLRVIGMKPGVLYDDFIVEDNPQYDERFIVDEMGISHINPDAYSLMKGTRINKEGFMGNWNYTPEMADSVRKSGKELLMIVGDSFTEGCCADSIQLSFPNLLKSNDVEVANFGVSCADPLQYKLIVEKYLPRLKPDKLIVAVYLGNDIMPQDRVPDPGIPLAYVFKDNKWLMSQEPHWVSGRTGYSFKSHNEAYKYYLETFTLHGDNRNWFEKSLSISVITSKLYLGIEHILQKRAAGKKLNLSEEPSFSYNYLKSIDSIANEQGVECFFIAIAPPKESEDVIEVKEKYDYVFNELRWYVPHNIDLDSYDGVSLGNHFNNTGHKEFAEFIHQVLDLPAE